jgi:UPF0755 protein
MRRGLRLVLWLMVLGLVLAGAGLQQVHSLMQRPLPLAQDQVIEIAPGASYRGVLDQLAAAGLLRDIEVLALRLQARLQGAPTLKAGEYRLQPGMTVADTVSLFRDGRVKLHALQLLEGWTAAQAIEAVRAHPAITPALDVAALEPSALMAALDLGDGHAEGRLRPETYHFPKGTTDAAFLRRAARAQSAALARIWAARQPSLPLKDADAALILASIVEKETGLASERAEVAGVFVNRLRLGMRLQTDPTIIYGLGSRFDGNLRRRDLEADGPYNTYTRAGLPPTPICLPGEASLQAAVQPATTEALFFVAKGDGSGAHAFSRTLEAHNRAVQAYLRRLRENRNR